MKKIRLDELMVQRGLLPTAEEAAPRVYAREVKVDGAFATSPAILVSPDADVQLKAADRFVSRGGLKLQAALEHFGVRVEGLRCIDVGASAGGFSDCLLQAGAGSVACVDVDYSLLAWKVRNDPRTQVFERTNIRTADLAALGAPFDVTVADLSFIGLQQLAGVFAQLCQPGGTLLVLVKPQFESEAGEAQGGYVADPAIRARTVREVSEALEAAGFEVQGAFESPVPGKKAGNIEFFVHATRGKGHGHTTVKEHPPA